MDYKKFAIWAFRAEYNANNAVAAYEEGDGFKQFVNTEAFEVHEDLAQESLEEN